ncbi:hypothetical protein OG892_39620 [Streptomyces sp. NBC_00341]|uniref:hypothetical protein n=1 Tax=Streptomyces sp. NBC_00341 TaxID=2975717 RepID=UPI0030877900|nr:hypothetical protein OG892_39620 [Streptomyces sp. NBC_00341]
MSSLWLFVPGFGWVVQPVPMPVPLAPAPVPQGCVVGAKATQGFGFRRALRWVRKIVITVVLVLTTAALAWMWHAGHGAEIAGELLVAVLIVAVTAMYKGVKQLFRSGGELAWR